MENKKNRIALVDDDVEVISVYAELLGQEFNIETYSSGPEFLAALKSENSKVPDLLISDFKMPQMNGLEMIQAAQQLGKTFPTILLSGYLDKQVLLEAVDIGIVKLLEKPITYDKLRAAVDQILIEFDVYQVRQEIRTLVSQLRELYTSLRLVTLPYLPEAMQKSMVVSTSIDGKNESMSFDDLLSHMESRLDQLLKSERVLNELRLQRYRS